MVVKAVPAETWSCFHSDDGGNGARNHVGRLLFSDRRSGLAKTTRSAKTRLVEVPLRGGDTFVTHAAHVWNGSAPLRRATTKAKAKKAASGVSRGTSTESVEKKGASSKRSPKLPPSFSLLPALLLLRGISRIFFSYLTYGGEE
jgi:hypothetical protein